MRIYIKSLAGKILELEVSELDTIAEVKAKVHEIEENHPPEKQRLIFAGKELEDHLPLHEYRIFRESTLHLLFKLGGI